MVCAPENNWKELYILSSSNMQKQINQIYNNSKGVILYEGSATRTFQLAQDFEKFAYLDVVIQSAGWLSLWKTTRIYPGGSTGNFEFWNAGDTAQYFWRWYSVGGNQFFLGDGYYFDFITRAAESNENIIIIRKVIGYYT